MNKCVEMDLKTSIVLNSINIDYSTECEGEWPQNELNYLGKIEKLKEKTARSYQKNSITLCGSHDEPLPKKIFLELNEILKKSNKGADFLFDEDSCVYILEYFDSFIVIKKEVVALDDCEIEFSLFFDSVNNKKMFMCNLFDNPNAIFVCDSIPEIVVFHEKWRLYKKNNSLNI